MNRRAALMAWLALPLCACSAGRPPSLAQLAAFEAPARDRCALAHTADFEGAGEAELHRYLHALARRHGPGSGVEPREVNLAIASGEPRPGLVGVTAGEVSCEPGNRAFRITLYREALVGRQLYMAYQTVAHEFQHVVQIRRDGLACGPPPGLLEEYEREAADHAARLVPACPVSSTASAAAASGGR